METEKLAKQVIGFHRNVFDNSFNAIELLQDQTEKMFSTSLERIFHVPKEGRRMLDGWWKSYKTECNVLKKAVDKNFEKIDFEAEDTNVIRQKITQMHESILLMESRLAALENRDWPQEVVDSLLQKKALTVKEDLKPLKKTLNQIEKGMPVASELEKIKKSVDQLEKKMYGLKEETTKAGEVLADLSRKLKPLPPVSEKVVKAPTTGQK